MPWQAASLWTSSLIDQRST